MKKITNLEDIEVYKLAVSLVSDLYSVISNNKLLEKEYFLCDQLKRSCVSISSNISEGYERGSRKDFIRFLYISKGSCSEFKTQILISKNLALIEEADYLLLNDKTHTIIKMLSSFINYLKTVTDKPINR